MYNKACPSPSMLDHIEANDTFLKKCPGYRTAPREQTKKFMESVKNLDLRETDPEKQGIFAVYLLMKGKYITQLAKLLEESETPIAVKLAICDFLLEEGFSETHATVEKILVEVCHIGLKEWQANKAKETVSSNHRGI